MEENYAVELYEITDIQLFLVHKKMYLSFSLIAMNIRFRVSVHLLVSELPDCSWIAPNVQIKKTG